MVLCVRVSMGMCVDMHEHIFTCCCMAKLAGLYASADLPRVQTLYDIVAPMKFHFLDFLPKLILRGRQSSFSGG